MSQPAFRSYAAADVLYHALRSDRMRFWYTFKRAWPTIDDHDGARYVLHRGRYKHYWIKLKSFPPTRHHRVLDTDEFRQARIVFYDEIRLDGTADDAAPDRIELILTLPSKRVLWVGANVYRAGHFAFEGKLANSLAELDLSDDQRIAVNLATVDAAPDAARKIGLYDCDRRLWLAWLVRAARPRSSSTFINN